jgi:hypothetical protein
MEGEGCRLLIDLQGVSVFLASAEVSQTPLQTEMNSHSIGTFFSEARDEVEEMGYVSV